MGELAGEVGGFWSGLAVNFGEAGFEECVGAGDGVGEAELVLQTHDVAVEVFVVGIVT